MLARCLANEYRVFSDNINIFPANSDFISFAEDTPVSRLAKKYQRNDPSRAGINLNIIDRSEPASVGFIDNFLASEFGYTAIQNHQLRM